MKCLKCGGCLTNNGSGIGCAACGLSHDLVVRSNIDLAEEALHLTKEIFIGTNCTAPVALQEAILMLEVRDLIRTGRLAEVREYVWGATRQHMQTREREEDY